MRGGRGRRRRRRRRKRRRRIGKRAAQIYIWNGSINGQ